MHVLEDRERIHAEPRLRVDDLSARCPVGEEARHADGMRAPPRQSGAIDVAPATDHEGTRVLPHRLQHRRQVQRIVLPVAVEGDDVRRAAGARRRNPAAQCLSLAETRAMTDHVAARGAAHCRGGVGRSVVDDDHGGVPAGTGDDIADGRRLVVRGNDDDGSHAASPGETTSATCVPPRPRPWTSPGPRGTRTTSRSRGKSPDRAVKAAAATRSAPSPAWCAPIPPRLLDGGSGPSARSMTAVSHRSRGRSPLAEQYTKPIWSATTPARSSAHPIARDSVRRPTAYGRAGSAPQASPAITPRIGAPRRTAFTWDSSTRNAAPSLERLPPPRWS